MKTNKQLKDELTFMCKWLQISERATKYIWNWFEATITLQCKSEREDAYAHARIVWERDMRELYQDLLEEQEDTFGKGPDAMKAWLQKERGFEVD